MFKYFPTVTKQFYPTQPKQSYILKVLILYCPLCLIAFLSPNFKDYKDGGLQTEGGGVGIDF